MKKTYLMTLVIFISLTLSACDGNSVVKETDKIEFWLTTPNQLQLFEKFENPPVFGEAKTDVPLISIDSSMKYQEMDGFGFALTGGSAQLLNQMNTGARLDILNELFGTDNRQIGISYLRLSIGASDLSDHVFSYNDLPPGETDTKMSHFSIDPEREDLIPVLKEILNINPDIKIMGSPWSPPVWMKSNKSSIGGSLMPEYYDAYALYFVKYIQAMADEGIVIDAITVQNEPLHPGNNPSLLMLADEQAAFISQSLGPAFRNAGIDTKIVIYDHNADRIDYPLSVLSDPDAAQYIDGSAFHLYGGVIDELSKVHEAFPDKNLYFTEQWIGAPGDFPKDLKWHTRELIVGATRNWCKIVLEWNLAADPDQKPHTRGGCTSCLGAITIAGNQITRNPAYYIVAHASRFVRPGSVRVASNYLDDLPNVAFLTSDGKIILIVLNDTGANREFAIEYAGKRAGTSLSAGSVGTFVW